MSNLEGLIEVAYQRGIRLVSRRPLDDSVAFRQALEAPIPRQCAAGDPRQAPTEHECSTFRTCRDGRAIRPRCAGMAGQSIETLVISELVNLVQTPACRNGFACAGELPGRSDAGAPQRFQPQHAESGLSADCSSEPTAITMPPVAQQALPFYQSRFTENTRRFSSPCGLPVTMAVRPRYLSAPSRPGGKISKPAADGPCP